MVATRKPKQMERLSKSENIIHKPSFRLEKTLDDFVNSLGEVLLDITALEVNTMVVDHISGDKFIPWEVYRDLYPISKTYLEEIGVHQSLRDRYLELRRDLELEYALLLTDANSEFYDPYMMDRLAQDCPILTNPNVDLEEVPTRLPDPIHPLNTDETIKVQKLLNNCRFLRSLRKISELKSALDNRNQALLKQQQHNNGKERIIPHKVYNDLIYAQTVIQLDGNILNRYCQEVFDHPHKDLILQIHRDSVMAGEKQWRGLLSFVIEMVQTTVERGLGRSLFSSGKNDSN